VGNAHQLAESLEAEIHAPGPRRKRDLGKGMLPMR
jgi:hypothetical protein